MEGMGFIPRGVAGLVIFLVTAWLASARRREIAFRPVALALALQAGLAALLLHNAGGRAFCSALEAAAGRLIGFSEAGSRFVFGEDFRTHYFAFGVLPTIVFVASGAAVLFHWGVAQACVRGAARLLRRVVGASGAEAVVAAANTFMGHTEAPLLIKPYVPGLTRAEIMVMMTAGMSTLSAGLVLSYAQMGMSAGHLVTSSVMAVPGAFAVARLLWPETETPATRDADAQPPRKESVNAFDAACRGAIDGVGVAVRVGACVLCFVAFVAMINWFLGLLPDLQGAPVTLERALGWLFAPVAWLTGVADGEVRDVGMLMGKRLATNEFVAYMDLAEMKGRLSERSFVLATYALSGFANFGSIAIQIGGFSALAPERRSDFASLAWRALLGGTLVGCLNATLAGLMG